MSCRMNTCRTRVHLAGVRFSVPLLWDSCLFGLHTYNSHSFKSEIKTFNINIKRVYDSLNYQPVSCLLNVDRRVS